VIGWDRLFVGRRFRVLNRLDNEWVETCCRQSVANDPNQVLVVHDGGFNVTRQLISQFNTFQHISDSVFNACVRLYRVREGLIDDAYLQSNRIRRPNRYYVADLLFIEKLLQNDIDGAIASIQQPEEYSKFIIPILKDSKYRMVLVDKLSKSIKIFDPFLNTSMPPPRLYDSEGDVQLYARVVMQFLQTAGIILNADEHSWLSEYPNYLFPSYVELVQYYEPITSDCDSGVYVLIACDYICNDVPCIFFVNNISHMRILLAHQVLVQKFPI
jgi:hypothetical protein